MPEKVTVFIDGANLLHALTKDLNRIDVDFELFVAKLVNGRSLVRVYYYTTLPNQMDDPERYSKQQKFLDTLQKKPYFSVVLGRLEKRGNGYVEKGVDISLAVDMMEMAFNRSYDTAIIVSGDGDFARVVQAVQRLGIHVENASTRSCLSRNLQNTCDRTIIIDATYLNGCWRPSRSQ